MAIKSPITLPNVIAGKNFTAELLPKVGTRNGMSCIYKIRLKGASKREGLYFKEKMNVGSSVVYTFDVGGNQLAYNATTNNIRFNNNKYDGLENEERLVEVIRRTLVHFGHMAPGAEDLGFTPEKPVDMTISETEQEAIPSFGVF